MPNTRSAKKAIRTIARRTQVNRERRSRIHTFVRRVDKALKQGDRAGAMDAFRIAEPQIARGGQLGVFSRKTASRMVSRLARRIKAQDV
ncbi:MAG: 30S ribosomal protein S20 [Hyphomicrobiales bacterium]